MAQSKPAMSHTEVYLDNTSMIGVAQLVCNPAEHLSAYTLLDLESFCEAFTLYDSVVSLRMQTMWFLRKTLRHHSLKSMRVLFREMQAAGVFSTRYASGHTLIDEEKIVVLAERLEASKAPSLPQIEVDGYLIKRGAFYGTGEVEDKRATYLMSPDELFRPTIWYFMISMYEGRPYLASSIRVPVVRDLVKACNRQGASVVEKCMEVCEAPWRDRIEKVAREFEGLDMRLALPPLLTYVLEQCNKPEDIGPAILSIRDRPEVVRFRDWCRDLQIFVDTGNVDGIYRALETLEKLSSQYHKRPDSIVEDIAAVLTIGASPLESILKLAKNNINQLVSWIRNRHFVFIKTLASSTTHIERNKALIERVFGVPLPEEELDRYAELRALDTGRQEL